MLKLLEGLEKDEIFKIQEELIKELEIPTITAENKDELFKKVMEASIKHENDLAEMVVKGTEESVYFEGLKKSFAFFGLIEDIDFMKFQEEMYKMQLIPEEENEG